MTQGPTTLCKHIWVANGGHGGEPVFKLNRQMGSEPIMHVMCRTCETRTWLSDKQWNALARKAKA